jgi:hypothetical protein
MPLFHVEWIDSKRIETLARKRGMPDGDDCVLDYAEPDDAAQYVEVGDFEAAVAAAKEKLDVDFFGQVRIDRVVKVRCRYTGERFEAEAVWHVDHDSTPVEDEPEYRPDIDLLEDEEFVV